MILFLVQQLNKPRKIRTFSITTNENIIVTLTLKKIYVKPIIKLNCALCVYSLRRRVYIPVNCK